MACANLFKSSGVPQKYYYVRQKRSDLQGRDNLNQWKSAHAIKTKNRTLSDAIDSDVFLDYLQQALLKKRWLKKWLKIL